MPLNEYYQIINNIRRHILFGYNNMRGTITAIMFQLLHKTTIYISMGHHMNFKAWHPCAWNNNWRVRKKMHATCVIRGCSGKQATPAKPCAKELIVMFCFLMPIFRDQWFHYYLFYIHSYGQRLAKSLNYRTHVLENNYLFPYTTYLTSIFLSCLKNVEIKRSREHPSETSSEFVIMEPETAKLGSSLLVDSVKELAKEALIKVPERYVHPNIEPPILFHKDTLPQLPIIDLNKLLSEDVKELEKLDFACKEWGFFQVSIYIFSHLLFHFYVRVFLPIVLIHPQN